MALRETMDARAERMTVLESPFWETNEHVGGVDEAGRGPLAGPVVAACVVLPKEPLILGINDSKKLSEKARERLYEQIYLQALAVGVGIATVQEIELLNIKNASRLAMERAITMAAPTCVLVDAEQDLNIAIPQAGIVHGDAVSYLIAAASIVAKVTRDHMMMELDKLHPEYGFAQHKGYGTAKHYQALRAFGPLPEHRWLFLRNMH